MDKVDLKDYVCSVPFSSLEIHERHRFLCCASWLKKYLPEHSSPKDAWESEEANDIRKSVTDGSFRHCDKTQCPYLHQITKLGNVGNTKVLFNKNDLPKDLKNKIDLFEKGQTPNPEIIQFSFDRTCNLKCPSCRIEIHTESLKGIDRVKKTIDEIQNQYGETTKTLYITGTGDPFVSVGFRDFLRNFDQSKWPALTRIHLHTNATKWNKKMWDSMPNIHKYVKSCEISIDAATKDTYENKVRLGGNWDELIENLKFISTIKTLKSVKTSFVVQNHNYKELNQFYELMLSIFDKKVNVFYGKINNWGTFTDEVYQEHKVWDITHPNYPDFIKEVNSTMLKDQIWHNLQEFIEDKNRLI
jgi:organic radical activating enzyme